ncbi:MAG: 30S ribosomal protein S18 [Patescibacteria group bacterium]
MITEEKKTCYFCANGIEEVDFLNLALLKKFINQRGKIIHPKRSGSCSKHQRKIATAVKRARTIALLSPSYK